LQSMSRKGNCWDNAVAESFFGTLKKELVRDTVWPSKAEARANVFEYIEAYYNRKRAHSALGCLSPVAFETCEKSRLAAQCLTTCPGNRIRSTRSSSARRSKTSTRRGRN